MNQCESIVVSAEALSFVVLSSEAPVLKSTGVALGTAIQGLIQSVGSSAEASDSTDTAAFMRVESSALGLDASTILHDVHLVAKSRASARDRSRVTYMHSAVSEVLALDGITDGAGAPRFFSRGRAKDAVRIGVVSKYRDRGVALDVVEAVGSMFAGDSAVADDRASVSLTPMIQALSSAISEDGVGISTALVQRASSVALGSTSFALSYDANVSVGDAALALDRYSVSGRDVLSPALSQFNGAVTFLKNLRGKSIVQIGSEIYVLGSMGAHKLVSGADVVIDTGFQVLGSQKRKRTSSVYLSGKTSGGSGTLSVYSDESADKPTTHELIDRAGVGPRTERFKVGKGSTGVYWKAVVKYTGDEFYSDSIALEVAESNRRTR